MSFLRLYARVLMLLRPVAHVALTLVAANLGLAVTQFAEPLLFGKVVDLLSSAQGTRQAPNWQTIGPPLAAWAGFALFSIFASVLVSLYADRLAHRRRALTMADYFEHVMRLPVAFHAESHSGRQLKIMLDGVNAMFTVWLNFFREHCASFVALFVILPSMLFVNWRFASIILALLVLFALAIQFVSRRTITMQSRANAMNEDLAERVSDALGNLPVVQSFTRVGDEARSLRELGSTMLKAQLPVLTWWAFAFVATRASATLSLLAIFLVGVELDIQGKTTVGQIVAFMSLATALVAKLEQVVGFVNFLFSNTPQMRQFFETMDAYPEVADRPGAHAAGRLAGEVRFEDVVFSYDGERLALDHVSLAAAPGQTIALVGATGSGKSTALSLLHRAFDPQAGRILVDGTDIRDLTLDSLRRNIGVVFQEPYLFARTIEENLRVGKPDATPAEMERALRLAQAWDFVQRQPEGLASLVGERGRNLSGGERQRLSIARAILKDPAIMVLDEATSALDAGTETRLQQALEAATRGRTTFVIAHRLATIRNADAILVFERGRIVESGPFDALVAAGGAFARLAAAQFMTSAAD